MVDEILRQRAKQMMRKRFRTARRAVPTEARVRRSQELCERLTALQAVQDAGSVALFYPIERMAEVDLRPLDDVLRREGKKLAYPRMRGPAPAMDFCWVMQTEELEDRGNGFWEPAAEAPEATQLDVIVVPGLAFDGAGNRLGYGGGCYDRILPRYPDALHIGVAFDFQLASDLPTRTGDVPVGLVVTDRQVLRIASPKSEATTRD